WDGTAWTVVPTENPGGVPNLNGVAAVSTNGVWAVGLQMGTLIEYYGGPCATATGTPSGTPTGTFTPTNTPTNTPTPSSAPISTGTATSTPCSISFTDVGPNDYF